MKTLFIGGTGNISTYCTKEALSKNIEVVHLNRGNTPAFPGIRTIHCDAHDYDAMEKALGNEMFDTVVQWVCFDMAHLALDIAFFRNRARQYVFISTASAYKKPLSYHVITEATLLANPYWEYSRKKIDCENLLWDAFRNDGFPMTIVRPSHTYSDGWFPTSFGSSDFTVPRRILDGRPVAVHGGGQSLWTLTHASDFALGFTGLLGNDMAIGEAFHITSDEALTWDNIHLLTARALGKEAEIVHVPVELICRMDKERGAGLIGDKAWSAVFDNSRIKRLVPAFRTRVSFSDGIQRSVEWSRANPDKLYIDKDTDEFIDRCIKAVGELF